MQAAERYLAVLILHQAVIGLQALEPDAKIEQVLAMGDADLIGGREKIADDFEVAAGVGTAVGELRSAV